MTNHAVDKQFALLEKGIWPSTIQSSCACILLLCSLKLSLLYNTETNLWQPAPRTTPTEKQWSLIQQPREPMLCSLLQRPKRALLTYFTSIPVMLISCLWSQNLGCSHTTFPWMAPWFLGASHLVLLCRSPTEGPALLYHPSRAKEKKMKSSPSFLKGKISKGFV